MKNKIKQAVILVGGYGTRLRPLSFVIPKPLIPVVDKPLLLYHIDNFITQGIREIIFCISYKSEIIIRFIKKLKKNCNFIFSFEKEPMGTGGAIKNAEKYLQEVFIAINGDIFSDFDLPSLLCFSEKNKFDIIIGTREVENPSKFGLLKILKNRKITEFLEKPSSEMDIDLGLKEINAGLYILRKDFFSEYKNEPFSIERNFFPVMLKKGKEVLGFKINSYWNDIGTTEEYLKTSFYQLNKTGRNIYMAGNAEISRNTRFVGNNIILSNTRIGKNVELENSIIFDKVRIGEESKIKNCILAPGVKIGRFVFISGMVLGSNTVIDDYSFLNRRML